MDLTYELDILRKENELLKTKTGANNILYENLKKTIAEYEEEIRKVREIQGEYKELKCKVSAILQELLNA